MLSALKYLLVAVAGVYLIMLALLYVFQERLIFLGNALPADYRFRFDLPFEELSVPVPGATLNALHFIHPAPRGLVFFLHGNAGNLDSWGRGAEFYHALGYDLFILDYRGYGKSTGGIASEAQLHADVRAAWDAIAPRYGGRPIVIYGRSLGSGLAVQLAREVQPALVVLVTPYTSLEAMARRFYPWVPGALLRYPLRTDTIIGELRCPVLLLHGTRDALIPIEESRALLTHARSPAELVAVEGAGHNDLQDFPFYREELAQRLRAVTSPRPTASP